MLLLCLLLPTLARAAPALPLQDSAGQVDAWPAITLLADADGSLDSAIDRDSEQPNDIPSLLAAHPSIRTLLLNGQKAAASFRRHHHGLDLDTAILPSTSPAHASMGATEKFAHWHRALRAALAQRGDPVRP